jgi:hypothetical protein
MNIVSFKCLNKRFSHAVRLGTPNRGSTHRKPKTLGKCLSVPGYIGRTIITEPFNRMRNMIHKAKSGFDGLGNNVLYHFTVNTACGGDIAHYFPIAAVQAEGYPYPFPVPAGDLENIGTPAQVTSVGSNRSIMGSRWLSRIPLKQQLVDFHDPVDPLMVDPGVPSFFQKTVQQRRDTTVSISGPFIDNLPNGTKNASSAFL